MNVSSVLTKDYENEPRFQTPGKQTQTNPISKVKMLLRLTINGRRESFGYYADEIEAAELEQYKKEKVQIDNE